MDRGPAPLRSPPRSTGKTLPGSPGANCGGPAAGTAAPRHRGGSDGDGRGSRRGGTGPRVLPRLLAFLSSPDLGKKTNLGSPRPGQEPGAGVMAGVRVLRQSASAVPGEARQGPSRRGRLVQREYKPKDTKSSLLIPKSRDIGPYCCLMRSVDPRNTQTHETYANPLLPVTQTSGHTCVTQAPHHIPTVTCMCLEFYKRKKMSVSIFWGEYLETDRAHAQL